LNHLGTRAQGKMGPRALPYPDQIDYAMDRRGCRLTPAKKQGTMKRKSSTLGLLQSDGEQGTVMSDRIFVFVVSLLALAMSLVFVLAVMPYA
jgi:hypothetical protein